MPLRPRKGSRAGWSPGTSVSLVTPVCSRDPQAVRGESKPRQEQVSQEHLDVRVPVLLLMVPLDTTRTELQLTVPDCGRCVRRSPRGLNVQFVFQIV